MVTRCSRSVVGSILGLLVVVLTGSCEKVPLLAPTGSTITLTASATALSANGTTTIIAQVLEVAGTPPHSGTHVTFTTTLGRIDPADVSTDIGGRAVVTFTAGGANGTATISALSGGATTGAEGALKIAVGTAAVARVSVSANPSTVPSAGGTTTISAFVLDVNGNPLTSTPVSFTTTAGALSSSLVLTDSNGNASTSLTTSQQATVTASVGAQAPSPATPTTPAPPSSATGTSSGSVVVNVAGAPAILITPPSTSPSKGLPATFTFVVTAAAQNGSAIRSVIVNWGDSDTQNLGTFTGSQAVQHVYRDDGSFTVTATVTDGAGSTNTTSTSVFVIPVPQPGIGITYSPVPAKANTQTTFNIQITAATGIGITSTSVNFGDGTSANLGGGASHSAPHTYTVAGTYTVTVSVTDTTNQTTQGSTSISVGL